MKSIWGDYCRQCIRTYLTNYPKDRTEFKRGELLDRYRDEWLAWREKNNYTCNENALSSHLNDILEYLIRLGRLENLGDGWYRVVGEI